MGKILLVDDNVFNCEMLCRRFQRQGYEVIVAEDGKQAIKLAASGQPDLILMDLSMPEMDGWDATRRLKSDTATRHIPVIVLTAHALNSERASAFEVGCDDYDTKPINFPRLISKIESYLDERN